MTLDYDIFIIIRLAAAAATTTTAAALDNLLAAWTQTVKA